MRPLKGLNPLVTILIPVKNAHPFLDECTDSIAEQDYENWECLFVNDHSTDGSAEHISALSFFDARFRCVTNEGDGLIAAYGTGLRQANGEIIMRMDADDIMPVGRIRRMIQALTASGQQSVVTGKVKFFPEDSLGVGTLFYEEWLNARMELKDHATWIWRECVIPSPCWMAYTADVRKFGLFEELVYPEDYELAFRFLYHGFRIESISETCHFWREHKDRHSKKSDHYSAERFMAMKWKWFEKTELSSCRNLYVLGTGAKAKILIHLLKEKNIPFIWMSHLKNVAGNRIAGMEIAWLGDIQFAESSCVISTLSSIDDFDDIYESMPGRVGVYRFC